MAKKRIGKAFALAGGLLAASTYQLIKKTKEKKKQDKPIEENKPKKSLFRSLCQKKKVAEIIKNHQEPVTPVFEKTEKINLPWKKNRH